MVFSLAERQSNLPEQLQKNLSLIILFVCSSYSPLPHFTRPVSGLPFWPRIITIVPSSEALASFRVALFNFHVGVAKVNFNYVPLFVLNIH